MYLSDITPAMHARHEHDCGWFECAAAARVQAERQNRSESPPNAAELAAALTRVRALADEWATAGGSHRRTADLIRAAIDGEEA